ncbi:MAG: sensor histidine kinase, partial [Candidatus Eisenbacteria bacterium]|nr:sensor histidine kinase [Candidatus Eisenbacteria bacterium]
GGSPDTIAGRNLLELFPRAFAENHLREIRAAIDSGRPVVTQSETLIRGSVRWYEARIWPLTYPRGSHSALLVLQDVTVQKESEQQILSYQERLRTLTSELALAEQRERRRIAAALHDGIGQNLALARIKLGQIGQARTRAERGSILEEVGRLLDASMQDTRTLTIDLSPPILYELGLDSALEWLADRFQRQEGLAIDYDGDGLPVGLAGDLLGFVFQSAQELIVNVVKHARARQVHIRKRCRDGRLVIEVADDGVGYDPGQAATGAGFGLFSIRERLRHLGGSVEVRTGPGRGTRVALTVPVRAANDRAGEEGPGR